MIYRNALRSSLVGMAIAAICITGTVRAAQTEIDAAHPARYIRADRPARSLTKGNLHGKALTVAEGRLYVVGATSFSIYDLQVPTSPTLLGSVALPQNTAEPFVQVVGDRAYVVSNLNRSNAVADPVPGPGVLAVYDVADPAAPIQLGASDALPDKVRDMAVDGPVCYLVGSFGLRIIDVLNPANLAVQSPHGSVSAEDLVVARGRDLFTAAGRQVFHYHLSDAFTPHLKGSYTYPAAPSEVTAGPAGTVLLQTSIASMDYAAGRLYVSPRVPSGISVLNVENNGALSSAATCAIPGSPAISLQARGGLLYVGMNDGVWVMDLSHPDDPAVIAQEVGPPAYDPGAMSPVPAPIKAVGAAPNMIYATLGLPGGLTLWPMVLTSHPGAPENGAWITKREFHAASPSSGQPNPRLVAYARNTGHATWTTAASYHLTVVDDPDSVAQAANAALQAGPVETNGLTAFQLPVALPPAGQTATVRVQMTKDGAGPFGEVATFELTSSGAQLQEASAMDNAAEGWTSYQ